MPDSIDKRVADALAKASAAIDSARDAMAKALHTHEMPGGDLTDPAEDTDGHQHRLPGDQLTGTPISTDEGHVHTLPGGGRTEPPFVAPAASEDDADKSAHPKKPKNKPKRRKDASEDALPVLLLDGAERAVARMRGGHPAGYLSKRSRVAKIGEPHALVGDGKVWAVVTQHGPVPINDLATADAYIRKAVDAAEFVGKGYYLPIRLSVVFDPPLELSEPIGKRKSIKLSADTGDNDEAEAAGEPDTKPIVAKPADDVGDALPDPPPAPEPSDKSATKNDDGVPVTLLKRHTADNRDGTEHFVMGVVLVPGEPDAHGDVYDELAVRNAAHSFMENGGVRKIMHNGAEVDGVVVLETFLTRTAEVHKDDGGETHLPVGTWLLAVRVTSQELWEAIQKGTFTGFSMGGTAIREKL